MHIAEGVLSVPVLVTGTLLSIGGIALGLKKLDYERIPQVALLSATFFVASLIHIPLGFASVHLVLNGLVGLLLGWTAFPALWIALLLQAVFFGFGGLTVLGVNAVNMALPAVICFYLLNYPIRHASKDRIAFIYGFILGIISIALTTFMVAMSLLATGETFLRLVQLMVIAHFPVMIIEGIISGTVIVFLRQVRPEILVVAIGQAEATRA
ncbi:MAG: cobalamin biosynthesis protein CbiM [Beggiatoa sp. IS2]|nr:MAG: cobalamin biosynthesis protein CbiM [Beggiatoa sp. IS2]